MNKSDLRKNLIKLRKEIYHPITDAKIINNLYNTKLYKDSKYIMIYVSYNYEINTHDFIKKSFLDNKHIITTKCNTINHTMSLFEVFDFPYGFEKNIYGILEVTEKIGKPVSSNIIELILVPGLAFNINGYRLGYGGGYYDRFLKNINRNKCISVGLSREAFILDEIPIDSYDQRVDFIITENRIINCSRL